jgi:hypothetical protein
MSNDCDINITQYNLTVVFNGKTGANDPCIDLFCFWVRQRLGLHIFFISTGYRSGEGFKRSNPLALIH